MTYFELTLLKGNIEGNTSTMSNTELLKIMTKISVWYSRITFNSTEYVAIGKNDLKTCQALMHILADEYRVRNG